MGFLDRIFRKTSGQEQWSRRVFVAQDETLRAQLQQVTRQEIERLDEVSRAFKDMDNTALARVFGKSSMGGALQSLIGWPDISLSVKEPDSGYTLSLPGPGVALWRGEIYVTVPDAAVLEKKGGLYVALAAQLREWTPPAGLREVDRRGLAPGIVGMPHFSPDPQQVQLQKKALGLAR